MTAENAAQGPPEYHGHPLVEGVDANGMDSSHLADATISVLVEGCYPNPPRIVRPWTTDVAAAWELIEYTRRWHRPAQGMSHVITGPAQDGCTEVDAEHAAPHHRYYCTITPRIYGKSGWANDHIERYGAAGPTMPLAVCRAFVKLMQDDPDPNNPKWLRERRQGVVDRINSDE